MANTYYDSTLTAAKIDSALKAVDGVIVPANNGKVLVVENGKISAKPVTDYVDLNLQAKTATPSASQQTISPDSGYNGLSGVTVEGVVAPNLIAENIKKDVVIKVGTLTDDDSVMSVVGSYEGGGVTPTGTLEITSNGIYDVTNYASVNVFVVAIETALIPTMTSNTTPSGIASSSSMLNAGFAAYKAFDGVKAQSSMQGGWLASASDYSPYLQYEFANPAQFNLLRIWTANNGETATRTVTVEGRLNGVWENCLKVGQNTTLVFTQGTSGESSSLHNIVLNGSTYDAIRITGNERFYLGVNQTACTFSEVQVYTVS